MREGAHVYRRRRATALLALVALLLLVVLGARACGGDGGAGVAAVTPKPPPPRELPRGGRRLFPDRRVVAFYGAPQDDELGVLGIGSPATAAAKLEKVASRYSTRARPALPAFELISTIAAAAPGEDGLHRLQQSDAVVARYLRAARKARALLVLDIQPGRGDFMSETRRLARWLREPDVALALDPEWRVGPNELPGQVIGSVTAEEVNQVSAYVAAIVRRYRLPEKLFVIHQFTQDMIEGKNRVVRRPGLAVTMNVDGFGDRPNKISKYRAFTSEAVRFRNGFKLFYEEDINLMGPRAVLRLRPPPDLVVYE